MPNHVTNRLKLVGNLELVEHILNEIGKDYPRRKRISYEDELIFKHNTTGGYGWFNEKTGAFKARIDGEIVKFDSIPEDYEQDWDEAYRQHICFENIVPPPDDPAYRDEPSQKEAQNSPNWWYTWNVENWGTKWGSYDTELIDERTIQFDTAWSPPLPVIETLSKKYPQIKFELSSFDEGWNFAEKSSFIGGVQDDVVNYNCNIEDDGFVQLCIELKGYDPREDNEDYR